MHFIVTAGPTREYIDPVRFLSNPSTGRMGFAVARAALRVGHAVTLVSGPVALRTPRGVNRINVVSARDMLSAVLQLLDSNRGQPTVLVMTAAVADWRPLHCASLKLKKEQMTGVLRLTRNPDILKTIDRIVRAHPREKLVRVGFAAETGAPLIEATRKCRKKGLDFIVGNDVSQAGCGFGTRTNQATLVMRDGRIVPLSMMTKDALARRIVHLCEAL